MSPPLTIQEGATLILAGRSQERMQAAARRIVARAKRAGVERPQVETASLDLASLASVRAFVAAFTRSHAQLDVLLLNAGVSSLPQRTLTEDGLETQFQVRAMPMRAHRHILRPMHAHRHILRPTRAHRHTLRPMHAHCHALSHRHAL